MFLPKIPLCWKINRQEKKNMTSIRKRPLWAALFLSISIILLAACEKPEQTVGLDVQPEDDLLNLYIVDTLGLEVTTVKEDSLKTDELSINLAGNYSDPSLGNVEAAFATQLRLPTNNVTFENAADIVIDSVVLSLVYEGNVYGNLNSQTWSVKEITEQLYVDSSYYSNRSFEVGDELVQFGFAEQAIDTESWIQTEGDSLPPQLRLRLVNSLGQRLLDNSGSSSLSNNDEFISFFKGILIRSETPDAGVIRFNTLSIDSKVTMYYRDLVDEDTLSFNLNINADCARINTFSQDYSATELQDIENTPLDGETRSYIQAGGGLKTRVIIPNLEDLNSIEQRTLNSVLLYLPVAIDDVDNYEPQTSLFALTTNPDGITSAIPDQLLGPSHIGGQYDVENSRYVFNITRFCQAILDGLQENNELFLVSNSAAVTTRRVILHGTNAFPESPDQNLRVIATFSN